MSEPLVPRGLGWQRIGRLPTAPDEPTDAWQNGKLRAISSWCMSEHAASRLVVPFYHVSFTENGARPGDDAVRAGLADFGMEDADEDNHFPGRARHFWLLVGAPRREQACECKRTEETVTEPDGYQWQKARDV